MTTKINGSWESINQYIERNTVTGECRLIGTTDIIPNLRYDKDNVGRNYAVTSFKEKRSTTTNTIATTYTPVRKVMIMLDDKLVEWDGKEYWKPIEWNDYYQVSTWGNVRNAKGNYLSPNSTDSRGYLKVVLYRNGKGKNCKVSRLVAEAFLPNPQGLSDVDHIDSKRKTCNMVDNLQWLSHRDNIRKDLCKPVLMLDKDTEEVLKEFEAAIDAAEWIKSNDASISGSLETVRRNINSCINGWKPSYYGYKWKYKD